MGEGAVRDRLAVGSQIQGLSRSAAAVREGRIGFGHPVVMAHTAGSRGDAFDEQPLLEKAEEQSVNRFWHTCQNYLHACDPDAYADAAEELFEQRELTIRRRRDGMYTIWGRIHAVGVATWRTALAPLARRRGKGDHRSHKQRLHDAVFEHAAGRQVTHLNVTVSSEALAGIKGASAAEIDGIAPIAMRTAERLACDCTFRRIAAEVRADQAKRGRDARLADRKRARPWAALGSRAVRLSPLWCGARPVKP